MEKCGRVGEATDDMTYAPFTLRLQTHTLGIYIYIYIPRVCVCSAHFKTNIHFYHISLIYS